MDLPISSKYRSTPNEPVTAAERDRVSAQLNAAFEAGEIDQETYSALLDQVFAAQRLGELAGPVAQLGKPAVYSVPAIVEQTGRPGELAPARTPSARTQLLLFGTVGGLALIGIVLLLIVLL